jgi:hypothetical protein
MWRLCKLPVLALLVAAARYYLLPLCWPGPSEKLTLGLFEQLVNDLKQIIPAPIRLFFHHGRCEGGRDIHHKTGISSFSNEGPSSRYPHSML